MRIDSLNYLPQFIIDDPDINELLKVEQQELDIFEAYVELIRDQVYISSASLYLTRYEKMFGLETNESLSVQERSARILAKLNTRTNSTVEAIKNVVTSISKSPTEIDENYDEYTFMINIIRDIDEIVSVEDIRNAVEIIKPAHLDYHIQMCYRLIVGLYVKSTIYRVSHDVCGNYGGELDYCGETPELSYLANIESISLETSAESENHVYPYKFAGVYPEISTVGKQEKEYTEVSMNADAHLYDYDMGISESGTLPDISTVGTYYLSDDFIQDETENYITQNEYCTADDFCGEE